MLKLSSSSSLSFVEFPIPPPKAVINVAISFDDKTFESLAFSQLIIFPFNGKIACVDLSRPCLADPPADSPSTIKISHFSGSFSWQSASFPGKDETSSAPFLLVRSLAFLAASLAAAASITFPTIILASAGCSSNQLDKRSFIRLSTTGLTSEETNLSFV